MVTVYAASITVVCVVGMVADVVNRANKAALVCKLRGKHKMDMYGHVCKCGYDRKKH